MAFYTVYLPQGEKLRVEADEYDIEDDAITFTRDGKQLNLYLNKEGVCIIPDSTPLKRPDEPEDETSLFKSI